MTSIVELSHLSFGYPDRGIFHDQSLSLPSGHFTVLIGPNGGGKTTLLKLLLGFLQPDSGSLSVLGATPGSNQNIGYVPQDVTATDDLPLSLLAVTLMGRVNRRTFYWSKEDKAKALAVLEEMKLVDYRNKPFRELSIGQRQRGLIARALVGEPKLLLLDEPLSSVDPSARDQLIDCLNLAHEKASVIMVSHDLTVIPHCATSVVLVNNGMRLFTGDELTEELLADLSQHHCLFKGPAREGHHVE